MVTTKELERILEVYKAPFHYDPHGQMIFDSLNHQILDIRGWGYLQKFPDAIVIQDNVGKLVEEFLNAAHKAYLMDKHKENGQ
jgi:hypothetical protein